MKKINHFLVYYYFFILAVLALLGFIVFRELSQRDLRLIVFDIGQGDAILIRTPNHRNILIDGGPDNQVVYKLGQYLPFYDRTIDLMILTHPHSDHLVGLIEVLKRYQVKRVLATGVIYHSADYLTWQELIRDKNIIFQVVAHPVELTLDALASADTSSADAVKLLFFSPGQSWFNRTAQNINSTSVVAKLVFGRFSALLTGDNESEEDLAALNLDLSATVLKVGHHGSGNANNPKFLAAVKPQLAVISYGQNSFGHPNLDVVNSLENLGAKVFLTKEQGDLILATDGQKIDNFSGK